MGHGDGIGAHAYVGYAGFEMKVSNGCDSHPLGDNIWVSLQVCDWVYVNGQRVGRNGREPTSTLFWARSRCVMTARASVRGESTLPLTAGMPVWTR